MLEREPEAVVGDERLSIAASYSAELFETPGERRDASFAVSTAHAAASLAHS